MKVLTFLPLGVELRYFIKAPWGFEDYFLGTSGNFSTQENEYVLASMQRRVSARMAIYLSCILANLASRWEESISRPEHVRTQDHQ